MTNSPRQQRSSFVRVAAFLAAIVLTIGCCTLQVHSEPPTAQPQTTKTLSKSDLEHGEHQLRAMLTDRPRMMTYVAVGDPVWNWMIRQFAGEGVGSRVFWSREKPSKPVLADHVIPHGEVSGAIHVARFDNEGQSRSGEQMWSGAVFELFNIRNAPDFRKAVDDAYDGKIGKEAFVHDCMLLEVKAGRGHHLFYEKIWLPNLKSSALKSNKELWWGKVEETDEELFQRAKRERHYNVGFWSDFYSKRIAPYVLAQQRAKKNRMLNSKKKSESNRSRH